MNTSIEKFAKRRAELERVNKKERLVTIKIRTEAAEVLRNCREEVASEEGKTRKENLGEAVARALLEWDAMTRGDQTVDLKPAKVG